MRLPNFYNHAGLKALKTAMGIPDDVYGGFRVDISDFVLTAEEKVRLGSSEGVVVDADSVRFVSFLADGTIAYKGQRVLLYIRDKSFVSSEQDYPRFHISNCETLRDTRKKGRLERYVVATDNSGKFKVNFIRNNAVSKTGNFKLRVCKNCLELLNYDGFSRYGGTRKQDIVYGFSISAFFERYTFSPVQELPRFDATRPPQIST